jgi:transporter family-2 protein
VTTQEDPSQVGADPALAGPDRPDPVLAGPDRSDPVPAGPDRGDAGGSGAAPDRAVGRHWQVPAALAVGLAVLGGVCSAGQSTVNGGLAERVGSPVVAGLVSNGIGTFLLVVAALTLPPVRAGLRRLRDQVRSGGADRLRWWQYLGGIFGALFVAVVALTVPVLGVALVTVTQVCGTTLGGVVTDKFGLGPAGRLPVTVVRLGSAMLAVVAVAVAQLGRPLGQVSAGLLALVLLVGAGLSVQSALNGRVNGVARNVGSASLVNAAVGTSALVLAGIGFGAAGRIPAPAWPGDWWLYLGGAFSIVIVGTSLVAVRTLGVLRSGLGFSAGQMVGALVLDALVPGMARPTGWLVAGAALTLLAVLLSGLAVRRRSPAS